MQKALYQYLFGNETLYIAPQPPEGGQEVIAEQTKTQIQAPQPPEGGKKIHQVVSQQTQTPPLEVGGLGLLILLESINDSERELLTKILKAIQLDIDDVDLVMMKDLADVDAVSILKEKRAKHIITFGVPLQKLKLDILLVPYQIKVVNGVNFLYSDALGIIENDKAKKLMLWNMLKSSGFARG